MNKWKLKCKKLFKCKILFIVTLTNETFRDKSNKISARAAC